jgi:hypothetical protein
MAQPIAIDVRTLLGRTVDDAVVSRFLHSVDPNKRFQPDDGEMDW